jgi:hypothetical protein
MMSPHVRTFVLVRLLPLIALVTAAAGARAADQVVNLPYQQADKDGNSWVVHFYGYLQQQGNMPVYSSTGVLTINGNSTASPRAQRQAKIDGKTGELVLEALPIATVSVTRRFQFNKEEGYVRIIDVIKNTQPRDQQVTLTLNANANYGVQQGQTVADPKKKEQNYAWIAQTSANNRAIVEMVNGVGTKNPFRIEYAPGNSSMQAHLQQLTIPANKEIAIMHVHSVVASAAEGQELLKRIKENKLLRDVPASVRKMIVNWNAASSFVGDYEILRGDLFDVVETRNGDQFRGTLKAPSYKITTFYGPVNVPADRVIALVSMGAVRPRQLLFTVDGDVFGGTLDKDKVALELSDGQVMEVPLSQVARVGYRRRPSEPEDPVFDKPFVLMRTGERIAIQPPTEPIAVHTRFGPMKLKPEALTAILFQNEEHAVHELRMTDGTRLAALVDAATLEVKLAGSNQTIKFPLTSAARLQLRPESDEAVGDDTPQLKLTNEETLVGTLSGKLQLDTGFSVLNLDAEGIKSLAKIKDSPVDVQVGLWDETSFRGQLLEPQVTCVTKGGLEITVPIALVEEYSQPLPKPSPAMVNKIKELVAQLNADEWNARDLAQKQLVSMGNIAAGVLKELRPSQPEEAQSRIDQILGSVEKKK